ncbi:uncharacterized protein [Drosophila pseudoobscura]|uniref:Uncharacterized protein n=1 Tax=Drosophila pseudoobscura pseudoobscura TaxID=46245 RepID=A0A6I8V3Z7_DROPS|nr:uncharacterized protein LOC6898272 [Drosophila pseudoobscura]
MTRDQSKFDVLQSNTHHLIVAMNQLTLVFCLLLWSEVDGAFRDFVVEPEIDSEDSELENNFQDREGALDENLLVSFQSVERDGIVDTQLLLKALMQHAQRLGLSLDELASMSYGEAEDEEAANQLESMSRNQDMMGCNSRDQEMFEYADRPTWRDVIFN